MSLLASLRDVLPAAKPIVFNGGVSDINQATLRGDLELVRRAVKNIPNRADSFATRESYLDIGYAIRAALPDHVSEAYELFLDWCLDSDWTDADGNGNKPDVVEADWRRMKPPYKRGAQFLYRLAEETAGVETFSKAEQWFDNTPQPEPLFPQEAKDDQPESADIVWKCPSEWTGLTPKPREWEVEGWIPRFEVTLLYGDGGIGKTLLAHLYATCASAGVDFLGQKTRKARVLCFFCEDSEDELHRRQIDLCAAAGVTLDDLKGNLRIASRKYMDNILALWDRNTGAMKKTAVWSKLRDDAIFFKGDVLILDTLADIFGGNEIDRTQVSSFVKACLGRLAQDIGGTVITLGHPSQSGKASGQGTSGSTAWSNAARSRLFLRYPKGVEKGDIRELEGMKSNYGPKGALLKLRWNRGSFDVIAGSMPGASSAKILPNAFGVSSVEDGVDAAVVAAILSAPSEGLSLKVRASNYAPRVLKRREVEMFDAFTVDEIEQAFLRLERKGVLREGEVGRNAIRKPVTGYVVVSDIQGEIRAPVAPVGVFE